MRNRESPRYLPSMPNRLLRLILPLVLVGMTACAIPEAGDRTAGWSVERLYEEAKDEMDAGRYEEAVKLLQVLESRYPFGRYAQQAKIDIAWAHYRDNERGLALNAIDRFIKLHPNHPKLDYVHYLKGLVNFNRPRGLLARLGGQDLSERDQEAARESFDSFRTVITRFPNSKYVEDSQQRMQYLVNSLASNEVSVARFYYQRGAYVAAANRAQDVVRDYQHVPAVEEALFILAESYKNLGMDDLADGAQRVLKRNFPDSTLEASSIAPADRRWWQVWN